MSASCRFVRLAGAPPRPRAPRQWCGRRHRRRALRAARRVRAEARPAAASRDRWIRAGALSDLEPHVPSARVLVVPRVDGWYRERARRRPCSSSGTATSRSARCLGDLHASRMPGPLGREGQEVPLPVPRRRVRRHRQGARRPAAAAARRSRGAGRYRRRHRCWCGCDRDGSSTGCDDRTGLRTIREVLFDEPLPPGTGWFFTLGSVLLALLGVQVLTGAFLTLYYAPTPDHAYDSVRFISSTTAGRLVRGLHHFGASFIVVAAALHMLRVIGVRLLQAAARADVAVGPRAAGADPRVRADRIPPALGSARVLGDGRHDQHLEAGAGRGRRGRRHAAGRRVDRRADADALVLRARHLPARRLVVAIVAAHLVLMRRQGISGPVRAREGTPIGVLPATGGARRHRRLDRPAGARADGMARHAGDGRSGRSDRRHLHSPAGVVLPRASSSS